ncbi:unnamed protein product [Parajaminaea phylloscopi]
MATSPDDATPGPLATSDVASAQPPHGSKSSSPPAVTILPQAAEQNTHVFAALSPGTTAAFSDPDYYHDRDGEDDVFSNPDTAELDARSDITGATSPDRAMSPAAGSSPLDLRSAANHPSASAAQPAELACPPEHSASASASASEAEAVHARSTIADLSSVPGLQQRPSLTSQLTQKTAVPPAAATPENITPTPSTIRDASSRPAVSAGVATPPRVLSRSHSRRRSMANPALTAETSTALLPAANDLPSDPLEASHISTLFAHPPAPPSDTPASFGSPATSAIRLALGQSPVHSASPSAAGSPISERRGFAWTSPSVASSAPPMQKSGSRGPNSPEHFRSAKTNQPTSALALAGASTGNGVNGSGLASPSRTLAGNGTLGLGLTSSPTAGGASSAMSANPSQSSRAADDATALGPSPLVAAQSAAGVAAEASIFERDIEHRDARHVLSKSEAVDVAIPPVLDDAVEAILDSGEQPLEIVAPLSSTSPAALPLSALALSASAHSLAPDSPAPSTPRSLPSAPMSIVGGPVSAPMGAGDLPPPGSIAAQIAERLAPSTGTRTQPHLAAEAAEADPLHSSTPARVHSGPSRHRVTHSSGASSVGSSSRSMSPGKAAPMGVQQVLDGSFVNRSMTEPSSPTNAAVSRSPRAVNPPQGPNVTTPTTPARHASPSQGPSSAVSVSGKQPGTQAGLPTALPSLPLPNPFRSETPSVLRTHSPSASFSSTFPQDGAATAPSSHLTMSLDGAVIPSSEAAIHEMSLDSMADAILIDAEAASPSPILPRKAHMSPAPSHSASFVRRDTSATIVPTTGRHSSTVPNSEVLADTEGSRTQSSPSTRRLSFFSYANIINDTPAEVVGLDQAVQRTLEDSLKGSAPLPGPLDPAYQARGIGAAASTPGSLHGSPTLASKRFVGSQSTSSFALISNKALGNKGVPPQGLPLQ